MHHSNLVYPSGDALFSFKYCFCEEKLLPAHEKLYRFITVNDIYDPDAKGPYNLKGNFYWIRKDAYFKLSSELDYDDPNLDNFTSIARINLALPIKFSRLLNSLIAIEIERSIWCWEGIIAKQKEILSDGSVIEYKGGTQQVYIPNLTSKIAKLSFFHYI